MTTGREIPVSATDRLRRHRAGSLWMDRGQQRHASGGPGEWAASVDCHRRAVAILSGVPTGDDDGILADLGAAWINLGCALQSGPSPENLIEALGAFERGMELLGKLPFDANPRFRHNLAAAWMNHADALVRIGTASSRANAAEGYARAIELAEALPLDEKPSFRVLLASCWINLGTLRQAAADFPGAVLAYDRSIVALGWLPRSGHRLACHHAATAWTNRGETCLSAGGQESAHDAVESAREALVQIEGGKLDCGVDAKLILRALQVMARGIESSKHASGEVGAGELSDIAERGLELALESHERDPALFGPFVVWFFSLGSRAYARHQPQFLAEFTDEMLRRCDPLAGTAVGAELRAIARQAAAGALEGLGRSRLLVAGTRQTELLMSTVRDLRVLSSSILS
jgi:tetratricopeptide (TPR) repeat protein